MVEYQRGSHTLHDIKYHLVWITKYRYHVLRGEVAERARDVIREICMASRSANYPGFFGAGPRAHVGVESPEVGAGEAGAVDQRSVVAEVAARVLGVASAILGSASVGAGVFLRDGGGGG